MKTTETSWEDREGSSFFQSVREGLAGPGSLESSNEDKERIWQSVGEDSSRGRNTKFRGRLSLAGLRKREVASKAGGREEGTGPGCRPVDTGQGFGLHHSEATGMWGKAVNRGNHTLPCLSSHLSGLKRGPPQLP